MNIGDLEGLPKKKRKRIGRGPGSGHGKTSGRGHKGQGARAGSGKNPGFEGGQMPLQRRIPKRGFRPYRKSEYQLVNLLSLQRFAEGQTVDPEAMMKRGLIKHADRPVKVLGQGELTIKLVVLADAFSQSAKEKIAQAGGEIRMREAASGAVSSGQGGGL